MQPEEIILVDDNDCQVGTMEKLAAHKAGKLHRCFSIFVFNKQGELLLQKRAKSKYHSGGLWTNTCCGHPKPGELTSVAAKRRLKEEMGFACKLRELFTFTYKTDFPNGLIEHEFDHVFVGHFDGQPRLNLNEADDWRWMSVSDLKVDLKKYPDKYTYWLKSCFDRLISAV